MYLQRYVCVSALLAIVFSLGVAALKTSTRSLYSAKRDISLATFQTDVALMSDTIIQLKQGSNSFAWALFNSGKDELEIVKLRVVVTPDGMRALPESKEDYAGITVQPSEEVSIPWFLNVDQKSYGTSGNIQAFLEMKDQNGKHSENVVLDKKCRFPVDEGYSIGTLLTTLIVIALFITFSATAIALVTYGGDTVAEFIQSGGNRKVLFKKKKNH